MRIPIKTMLAAAALGLTTLSGCTTASDTVGTQAASNDNVSSSASPEATAAVNHEARALLPEEILDQGELLIASDPTYAPFEYYAADNQTMIGWDIDMGNAIAASLGLQVKHVPVAFDAILPGIASGKYHLGMSTFGVTEERRKTVDFVPNLQAGTGLAVPPGNPEDLSMDSLTLCGKSIAAQKGSLQSIEIIPAFSADCTEAGKPQIAMKLFPAQTDANLALTSGRVDAVMADSIPLAYQGQLSGNRFELAPGEDYSPELIGAALEKDSDLVPAVQKAMQSIIDSDVYGSINEKWNIPAHAAITSSDLNLK